MKERWRTVPWHLDYEASDQGRVRNRTTRRTLKPWVHKSGHLYLRLGRGKNYQVHHIILAAFGKEAKAEQECRHLDGNADNNVLRNLKWGTRRENIDDYRTKHGRHMRAALTDATAASIRSEYSGKHGEKAVLARKHGVSQSTVGRILAGGVYAFA